jgi:hypothetical protein
VNIPAVPQSQTPWITTTAERTALGEPEPKLTISQLQKLTISQLQSLLLAAAELERAQRPIVLHGPQAYPTTACQTATATHAGMDVRIPGPPVALAVAKPKERSPRALIFMTSACIGIGSCLVTSVTGSLASMGVTLAAFAVWGVATYNIVFKEQ